jgi:hypothetical protein
MKERLGGRRMTRRRGWPRCKALTKEPRVRPACKLIRPNQAGKPRLLQPTVPFQDCKVKTRPLRRLVLRPDSEVCKVKPDSQGEDTPVPAAQSTTLPRVYVPQKAGARARQQKD